MPIRHHTSIPSLIIAPHTATYSEVIKAKAGDLLSVGNEDDQFPGWLLCTDSNGISSWVPKEFLKITGSPLQAVGHEGSNQITPSGVEGRAELLSDYDATELTVNVGETVIVYAEQSGWLWCQTVAGQWGWVPKECVAR